MFFLEFPCNEKKPVNTIYNSPKSIYTVNVRSWVVPFMPTASKEHCKAEDKQYCLQVLALKNPSVLTGITQESTRAFKQAQENLTLIENHGKRRWSYIPQQSNVLTPFILQSRPKAGPILI